MERFTFSGKVRNPGIAVYLALLALLVAVNAAAIAGIFAAREGARREALAELALETEVHARRLEAGLAGLRGDLVLLSRSSPLTRALPDEARDDPMAQRWRRLDVEGTVLLFLAAHPSVARLVLTGPDGGARVVAGRSAGAPVVLPPDGSAPAAVATDGGLLVGRWTIGAGDGGAGTLEATVSLPELLEAAAPGFAERLTLLPEGAPEAVEASGLAARAAVRDDGWQPPLVATLVRRESGSRLVRSVEELAGRFRTTVVLNVAIVGLTVTLGFLAFRQARRAARLAVEKAHEVRLRELERQLLHSERLAGVGRLAAGMAHEINNPLEGMANYLSLVDDELAAGDCEAARGHARRVREGLERAAGILRRVLAMSASGRDPREELDLAQVVAEAVGFVRAAATFPGVELRLAGAGAPLPITGSPVALGQLVLNLLINACQAQPAGGEVAVTTDRDGRWARVVVADRGPGLPPGERQRLFEPFFSTRGSTGLGLAVCHRIAADHDGEIAAGDRPGGGAEFVVRLPLRAATGEATAATATAVRRAVAG